jgi:hypothetical protein
LRATLGGLIAALGGLNAALGGLASAVWGLRLAVRGLIAAPGGLKAAVGGLIAGCEGLSAALRGLEAAARDDPLPLLEVCRASGSGSFRAKADIRFTAASGADRLNATSSLRSEMEVGYTTESLETESSLPCPCCGRPIHHGTGWLLRGDEELAFYSYRWTEGHEARFYLAVAGTTSGHMRQGFAVVSCRRRGDDLHYTAVGPEESPWEDSETLGRVLSREEALNPHGLYPDLWSLTDAIAQHEPRLAERILTSHGM